MRSSLLESVEIKVFHATEAYSSLDLNKVKYNIKRLSRDGKETRPYNLIAYKNSLYNPHAGEFVVNIKENTRTQ
jgi:hypothetical protein